MSIRFQFHSQFSYFFFFCQIGCHSVNRAPKFRQRKLKKMYKKYAIRDMSCCYCYHSLNMHQSLYEFQWRSTISWTVLVCMEKEYGKSSTFQYSWMYWYKTLKQVLIDGGEKFSIYFLTQLLPTDEIWTNGIQNGIQLMHLFIFIIVHINMNQIDLYLFVTIFSLRYYEIIDRCIKCCPLEYWKLSSVFY